jgi:hypothetical protein
MDKLIFILFSFFILACKADESLINIQNPNLEKISFDVVEKNLIIEANLPIHVQFLVNKWFDQKIKINGFDGEMKLIIYEYVEEVSSIGDGKKIDLSMSFKIILNKPSLSQTKFIEGIVSSFGTLTGDFSLSEFDTVIQNTQSDLIIRLSRDLQSKI